MKDVFFLGPKSEPATREDLQVGRDLQDTLKANRDKVLMVPDPNVFGTESGKKIIVSFIEIMEIGTIKEYCWIRVINQLIFIRKENFVIGDIEDFKRFIKLNTLAGEDWSRVWKGRN